MIEIDGSVGEGGGQMLRSSLTLSAITRQPFRITNIRANRDKPGLRPQHLVAVRSAAAVCGAQMTHAEVGSTDLTFSPGAIRAGDYDFPIGTAGSTTLVLQTVLLPLLFADRPSRIRISGGTHNHKAPPAQFVERAYARLLRAMGADVEIRAERFGFYPVGGGVLTARVAPCAKLARLDLRGPGQLRNYFAESVITRVPLTVAQRELECVRDGLGWDETRLHVIAPAHPPGPGNALLVTIESEYTTEVFSAIGEKQVRAEAVAQQAVLEARRYLASGAAVGEHLADQLMLPLALAGGGSYTVDHVSQHSITNAEVIARFLPVEVIFEAGERFTTCTVRGRNGS